MGCFQFHGSKGTIGSFPHTEENCNPERSAGYSIRRGAVDARVDSMTLLG